MSEQKPVEELPTPSMEDDAERVTVLKRVPGDELAAALHRDRELEGGAVRARCALRGT